MNIATCALCLSCEEVLFVYNIFEVNNIKLGRTISDKLDDTFCVVPFVHLSTSPLGTLRPCCFSSQEKIKKDSSDQLVNLGSETLDEIWNSEHYREIRLKMINGEKLSNCDFCYKEEKLNKRSKRNKENDRYKALKAERMTSAKSNQGKLDSPPVNLDLRLGNLCNLKCITCNPVFSSQIEQEMNNKWPDNFFLKKEYSTIKIENGWFDSKEFKNNLSTLLPHLEFIYVSGGEPVINKSLIDFLRDSVSLGYSKKQKLRFNTNLMVLNDDFFSLLENFEEVDVSVSLDAIGDDLRVIRYPSSFDKISKNIESMLNLKGNIKLTINCTVSLLNIFSLKDLYLWVSELSLKYKTYIHISVDLVHEPIFISLPYLEKKLKPDALEEIISIEKLQFLKGAALKDLLSLKDILAREPEDRVVQQKKLVEYIVILEKSRSIPIFNSLKSLIGLPRG